MGVDTVMYIDIPGEPESAEEVKKFSVQIQKTLHILWVQLPTPHYNDPSKIAPGHHGLEIASGAPEGHWRVGVNTFCRYYGPGYERGPYLEIMALAEFMRRRWPNGVIHYGGDSDDEVPPLDDAARQELADHFFGPASRAYFEYMGTSRNLDGTRRANVEKCDWCDIPISFNMGGNKRRGGYCLSCHRRWVYYDDGRIVECVDDYETPKTPGQKWFKKPTITLDLGKLKAVIQTLTESGDARLGAVELEHLMMEVGK